MQEVTVAKQGRRSWWMLLLLPFAPVVGVVMILYLLFAVVIFGSMYVLAETSRRWRALSLRRAMRGAGRLTTWNEVSALLATQRGTLIVDCPSLGWSDTDVWWTGEIVAEQSLLAGIPLPVPPEKEQDSDFEARMQNPIFDRWCQSVYLDRKAGRGSLVQSTLSGMGRAAVRRRIDALQNAHPHLQVLDSSSCMVGLSSHQTRENATGSGPERSPDTRPNS